MVYFIRFCTILLSFGFRFLGDRKKSARQAETLIRRIELQLEGYFDKVTYHKVVKSYSVYKSIVLDPFSLLHGRRISLIEQERSIHYFICSSLFDNFFDDRLLTVAEIESITFQPESYTAKSFDEKAFLLSHLFLLNGMKDTGEYLTVLRREFEAQRNSLKQFDPTVTDDEIQQITFEKGGNAVLMCRYYLNITPVPEEEDCWFTLGTLIQLSNDLFDIYKDLQDRIHTLPVRCYNAYEMEQLFLNQVGRLKSNIALLPYSGEKKQAFSIAMATTYALGITAIEQLKSLQGKADRLPHFETLPRKALIIDMEKPANRWRWIRQVYRMGNLSV